MAHQDGESSTYIRKCMLKLSSLQKHCCIFTTISLFILAEQTSQASNDQITNLNETTTNQAEPE